ncbi:hypothetical protein TNCV_4000691 [Trichonephila clavipes]|nr:hypothetical protein TNCV_4000691 [Trichonephila clavipes]
MQITGNHQMARIVRHNDESVREGYIRNGGKEVILFQSTITSKADVSCTPIGPPLLKSRPPLQTQASNTTNIRVPDRGLKAAGAA